MRPTLVRCQTSPVPTTRHPYLEWTGPIAFAHRGGGAPTAPENTLPAFEHAVASRYRYPRDRRAGDRRRRAAGVPRRRSHRPRPTAAGSASCRASESAAAVDGEAPIPLRGRARCVAGRSASTSTPSPTPRSNRWSRHRRGTRRSTGSHRRVQRPPPAIACGAARRLGVDGARPDRCRRVRCRAGAFVGDRSVQVPSRQGPVRRRRRAVRERAHRRGLHVHVWTIDDPERDGAAARPRRRRDHDRPPAGAARRVRTSRALALERERSAVSRLPSAVSVARTPA